MRTQLRENVSLFTKSMSRWIQLTPRGVQIYRINAKEFQGVGRRGVLCVIRLHFKEFNSPQYQSFVEVT